MIKAVDTIIIGGGCAGLSLASKLAEASQTSSQAKSVDVLVIEPRSIYNNDRTWCFWSEHRHPLADTCWSSWLFSNPTTHTAQHADQQLYQCIRASDFYQAAIKSFEKSQQIRLSMGHRVTQITPKNNSFVVHTNKGSIEAHNIIDTRPPDHSQTDHCSLQQSFIGVEVKTEEPLFNPQQVTLMGDMGCDQYGFYFTYILPFSTTHALLEPTRFHLPGIAQDLINQELESDIHKFLGDRPYSLIRKEHGIIPMGFSAPPTGFNNWVLAGTGGGAVRASSGYAFTRIQQWADQCCAQILAKQTVQGHQPDGWIYRHMDALFLRTIKQQPDLASQLFMNMAKGMSPEGLVRFLTNQASLYDFFKLIKCLPTKPFIEQIKIQLMNKLKNNTPSTSNCK